MPTTRSIYDCRSLCDAAAAAGGTVPEALGRLLDTAHILMAPGPTADPLKPILDKALSGGVDAKTVDRMLAEAAAAQNLANYRADLRVAAEPAVVRRFHKELADGCADLLLDSMRPQFDAAAEQIARARSLISPESNAEHIIQSGQPELVSVWQTLDGYLNVVSRIAAVAREFGPRGGNFSQVVEYAQGEGFKLNDTGLMCGAGGAVTDSAPFMLPDRGHRTSPFFRIPLRLNTIEQVRDRYNDWAAEEFDRLHAGSPGSWIDEDGVHEHPRPKNPYRATASVR